MLGSQQKGQAAAEGSGPPEFGRWPGSHWSAWRSDDQPAGGHDRQVALDLERVEAPSNDRTDFSQPRTHAVPSGSSR